MDIFTAYVCLPLLSWQNRSIWKSRSVIPSSFYCNLPLQSLSLSYLFCSHRCMVSALHFSPIASFDLCSPGLSLLISCTPTAFPLLFSCLSCVLFLYLMCFSALVCLKAASHRSMCVMAAHTQQNPLPSLGLLAFWMVFLIITHG